jgi:ADP-heptose:LPS heptosyltransferase
LFDRVIDHPPEGHRLTRWTRLASALSGRVQTIPQIGPSSSPVRRGDTVILHPFVSDPRRQVPQEIFLAIIAALPAACKIRLSLGPGDLERHPHWRVLLDGGRVSLDPAPLAEKLATLKTARLLVSVDTCMVHLGALAGTPTLCLCTDAYRGWSIPYDPAFAPEHVRFAFTPCDHGGCLGHCVYPLEDGLFRCISHLSTEALAGQVRDLLAMQEC